MASEPDTLEIPSMLERLPDGTKVLQFAMIDFVHRLILPMLDGRRATLQAEPGRYEIGDPPIPWMLYRQNEPGEQIGYSPSFGAFRAALAAFGSYYLAGEPYGGFRAGRLRYRDNLFFYTAYMSNNNYELAGFWLRMDIKALRERS